MQTVALGDNLKNIGDYAFYACYGLTEINIPDSIVEIGEYAFSTCYNLTISGLSSNIQKIGAHAFEHCTLSTRLTIDPSITNVGEGAFSGCYSASTGDYYCIDLYIDDYDAYCNMGNIFEAVYSVNIASPEVEDLIYKDLLDNGLYYDGSAFSRDGQAEFNVNWNDNIGYSASSETVQYRDSVTIYLDPDAYFEYCYVYGAEYEYDAEENIIIIKDIRNDVEVSCYYSIMYEVRFWDYDGVTLLHSEKVKEGDAASDWWKDYSSYTEWASGPGYRHGFSQWELEAMLSSINEDIDLYETDPM